MAKTDQVPTQSGFGRESTGEQVLAGVDLTGKTAVVTGGYSGIGLETTRLLAAKGARVVVPVRSKPKAEVALAGIRGVETVPLDLADLASVRGFADSVLGTLQRLDLLINNAGVMACPLERVGPGWESQFAINHLGHFALTRALMPLLRRTEGVRVVALSSAAHKLSDVRWDDLHFADEYDKWKAYGQSKTANALFANALSRRLAGSGGLAFSLHPGAIFTPLQRHLPREEQVALGWLEPSGEVSETAKKHFKTVTQGCATTLWVATSPKLEGKAGVYCEDCDVAAPSEPGARGWGGVREYACDDEAAERLWALSEALLAEA